MTPENEVREDGSTVPANGDHQALPEQHFHFSNEEMQLADTICNFFGDNLNGLQAMADFLKLSLEKYSTGNHTDIKEIYKEILDEEIRKQNNN